MSCSRVACMPVFGGGVSISGVGVGRVLSS